MKYVRVLLVVLLTFFPIFYAHAERGADERLLDILSYMHSMRADFVQTNQDARGHVLGQSSGTMMLLHPGKFRWEVKRPQPQQIIADGKQLWIYDPALAQVTRHKMSKPDLATSAAALLSDSLAQLPSRYQIKELSKASQEGLWFKLSPKKPSSILHWVELHFIDGDLVSMRIADNLDQVSMFSFRKIQMNLPLKPELFQFSVPAGVEIVDA